MKKIISVILLTIFIMSLCGCEYLFIKKDTLIGIEDNISSQNGFLTIKVNSYTDVTNAFLLDYSTDIDTGIYVYKDNSSETQTSELYLFTDVGEKRLFATQNTYTYAQIDSFDETVYFKEADSKNMTVSLYKTDFDASYKTKILENPSSTPILFDADKGGLVYIDNENNLIKNDGTTTSTVYSFSTSSTVKKVAYYAKENFIFVLVGISAKSNILYMINEENGIITAIDAGVTEFEFSNNNKMLYYIKSAGETDQIYSYSLDTLHNEFIYSGSISDITISPHGSYIAYCTKTKDEGTFPSIWLITTVANEAVQLTAYTPISSDIYFVSSNEIMFTTVETNEQSTITTLKKLEFETTYSKEGEAH